MKMSISSDKEFVKNIREKIKENEGYCISQTEKNNDTKCICKEFKDKMENRELGKCKCGLYTITEID